MQSPRVHGIRTLPDVFPVFPLAGVILLPRGQLPLNVFEPRYLAMVDDAFLARRMIGIIQPIHEAERGARPELYGVGGVGRITSYAETDDGRYLITLTGLSRFEIKREIEANTPYRQVEASYERFARDRSSVAEDEGARSRGLACGA